MWVHLVKSLEGSSKATTTKGTEIWQLTWSCQTRWEDLCVSGLSAAPPACERTQRAAAVSPLPLDTAASICPRRASNADTASRSSWSPETSPPGPLGCTPACRKQHRAWVCYRCWSGFLTVVVVVVAVEGESFIRTRYFTTQGLRFQASPALTICSCWSTCQQAKYKTTATTLTNIIMTITMMRERDKERGKQKRERKGTDRRQRERRERERGRVLSTLISIIL